MLYYIIIKDASGIKVAARGVVATCAATAGIAGAPLSMRAECDPLVGAGTLCVAAPLKSCARFVSMRVTSGQIAERAIRPT